MTKSHRPAVWSIGWWALAVAVLTPACGLAAPTIELIRDGISRMPILVGSVREPANELRDYLKVISGADVRIENATPGSTGIYVGIAADFPWLALGDVSPLGPEGFLLQSFEKGLCLIAREPQGVQHAVQGFLHSLGCRWFFPGANWEVLPRQKTVAGSWEQRQVPSFSLQRRIVYGFGAYPSCARDLVDWERHNCMGGPIPVNIGHTWHGLDPKSDFAAHPDWFAFTEGKRKPSKPCYSHPEVIQTAIRYALQQAATGAEMISMTPPDGLGYCECDRCLAVCRGAKPFQDRGALFAHRPDGVLINVTSETLFQFVNQVAAAVAARHAHALIGCYAYSAYSHPPSFPVHSNVFVQTTTAFRRTPLSLAEQLDAFQKIGVRSGIRGYFSVYQWDWDYPSVSKGDLALPRLVDDLRFYAEHGVQSVNAEASCNWAARGLGYYLAARLMWAPHTDPHALISDFYATAFGPAATPMERYFVRWLGPYVSTDPAVYAKNATTAPAAPRDELAQTGTATRELTDKALKGAFQDLNEATRLAHGRPDCQRRIDDIRLYVHYLGLRLRLKEAAAARDCGKVRAAVAAETVFAARLTNTNLVHSRPLLGKEFYRRFLPYKEFLEGTVEWPASDRDSVQQAAGKGYRQIRADIPDRQELERLWDQDMQHWRLR